MACCNKILRFDRKAPTGLHATYKNVKEKTYFLLDFLLLDIGLCFYNHIIAFVYNASVLKPSGNTLKTIFFVDIGIFLFLKGKGDHSEVQDKFCSNFQNMLIRSLL